ncbi:hypothetical protein IQ268_03655 [Oculatella sp. LEGE 06141]|uniref:hypothetical protein n=1 Tax=Oculatella sp. LEGE 06141 TaxID=1828648 RepID=UPI0018827B25|nr:hypothetical protein [Oculatella sp. LEGE 06141]MBE9177674.1 hypothetical protein [Oculatella sp. LEGE 06141]
MAIQYLLAKSNRTLAVLLGGSFIFLGLGSTPLAAIATPLVKQTSQPSIFQEPPYNRTPRETAPLPTTAPTPATTPAPTELLPQPEPRPDGVVNLAGNRVTIQMVNETGAAVSYQVVGDTEVRTLAGRTTVTLRDLPAPTTLTFRRQDQGLLVVTLRANAPNPGTLIVNLDETTDFAADRTTLNISELGEVFLN